MSPTLTAKKPRRPPSKQVPEKETAPMNATAAKLLVAAGDLMIERNSTEVSLSEIAQKSGVNAALVKYHFGNKDGLLLALLARDAAAEMTNLAFVLDQPISPTEKMRRHIAGIVNAYYRVPYLNRLIHLLLHQGSPATAKEVHRFFVGPLFEFVKRLLEQGMATGEFRKVDPALFYISLNGACDHLFYGRQMNAHFVGSGGVTDEVRRQYIDHMTKLVLGGLLAGETTLPEKPSGKT